MHRLARVCLAVLGAALIVPHPARAGDDAPVSRSQAGTATPSHRHGLFNKGYVCPACAAKRAKGQSQVRMSAVAPLPDGSRIVGCAHSQNGVCAECKALLEMPGQLTTVAPPAMTDSGRAVASDAAPGHAVAEAGEPEPIGVMQTNFRQNAGPSGMPAGMAGASGAPSAMPAAPAGPGRAPFLSDTGEARPYILAHFFGLSAMHRDIQDAREMKVRRKREAHAAISYGTTSGTVDEVPASAVFGKRGR